VISHIFRSKSIKKSVYLILTALGISAHAYAQSPEISLREFASGQIKKGVRSIGMGGDGATWGNYSLVWKDSCTALLDAGTTHYLNGNNFSFDAIGVTTPSLWHGMTIYAIALSQYASDISASLRSPGLGPAAVPVHGDGNNQAVFIKAAMPLNKQFSFGILLSYERSQFDATSDNAGGGFVKYKTNWLPSGGFGLTYQPDKRFLIGFRALFNQDSEVRTDNIGMVQGLAASQEYRLGVSAVPWKDAIIDAGGNLRSKQNHIAGTSTSQIKPNIGFEQNFWGRHFALRAGVDETSGTGGFTLKLQPITVDFAYVNNIGIARVGNLFGQNSNSFIATVVFNYGYFMSKRHNLR
jgi:hypothetical protein